MGSRVEVTPQEPLVTDEATHALFAHLVGLRRAETTSVRLIRADRHADLPGDTRGSQAQLDAYASRHELAYPYAFAMDVHNAERWTQLLDCVGWLRATELRDADGHLLLAVRDGGSSVTALLDEGEVADVRRLFGVRLIPLTDERRQELLDSAARHEADRRRRAEELRTALEAARAEPAPDPEPPHPAAAFTGRVTVVLDPPHGEALQLRGAVGTVDSGSPNAELSAELSALPGGWFIAEVVVPDLPPWGLPDGSRERLVLRDRDAEVLVQRGIRGFACPVGAAEPPLPRGRTCWRVDVRAAGPGTFAWTSELHAGRTVSFVLVLAPPASTVAG